jgi:hypothetical protein
MAGDIAGADADAPALAKAGETFPEVLEELKDMFSESPR